MEIAGCTPSCIRKEGIVANDKSTSLYLLHYIYDHFVVCVGE